jgi:hypothetical protein
MGGVRGDHAAAAAWAWMRERRRLGPIAGVGICIAIVVLWSRRIEQLARPRARYGLTRRSSSIRRS